jgi:hypothetical protein
MKKATVVIDKLADTEEGLRTQLVKSAQKIGLDTDTMSARAILIKPNLTYPTYKKGVTTRIEFILVKGRVVITVFPWTRPLKPWGLVN